MPVLTRQEVEEIDRFVNVDNPAAPETVEALCETALAEMDRADNLAFELQAKEQARLQDNAHLLERAEKAERSYRRARNRAEKAEHELACARDELSVVWPRLRELQQAWAENAPAAQNKRELAAARDRLAAIADALQSSMPVGGELLDWRASVRDKTLEEAAALVEDEGPCRHVDHVQDICACIAKASMIRAMKGGKS